MKGIVDTHWTRIFFYDLFDSAPGGKTKPAAAPSRIEGPRRRQAPGPARRAARGPAAQASGGMESDR